MRTGPHTLLMRCRFPRARDFFLYGLRHQRHVSALGREPDDGRGRSAAGVGRRGGQRLETPVYEAEAAKDDACDFLHHAVFDRCNRDPSFFEQFTSDLSSAIVLMLPIGQVEDCADAFAAYSAAVDTLAATHE